MYYQCEFLDAKLLGKTLDIIDEVLHVVGIDSLGFPRLIVPSEEDWLESEPYYIFLQKLPFGLKVKPHIDLDRMRKNLIG